MRKAQFLEAMMGLQSAQVLSLEEYWDEERTARTSNLSAFDLELELGELLFQAAQHCYAAYPILVDAKDHRVRCSLVLAAIRYYASAVDLCVRGNGAEGQGIMRSAIECVAFAWKLKREPHLVDDWINLDDRSRQERRKLFGADSDLVAQPETASTLKVYEAFSRSGVHARIQLAEQAIDFQHPIGWRLRHAERGSHQVRFALFGIIFAMRDLVGEAIAPLYLESPLPSPIPDLLASYETRREGISRHRSSFLRWVENPGRSAQYDGRVTPARAFWRFGNRP